MVGCLSLRSVSNMAGATGFAELPREGGERGEDQPLSSSVSSDAEPVSCPESAASHAEYSTGSEYTDRETVSASSVSHGRGVQKPKKYHGVIVHHKHQGELALEMMEKLKAWIKKKHKGRKTIRLELYGNIDPFLFRNIEQISKQTRNIVIFYTPEFEADEHYQHICLTLFGQQSNGHPIDIIPVVHGFTGDRRPNTKRLALGNSIYVTHDDSKYFYDSMQARLMKRQRPQGPSQRQRRQGAETQLKMPVDRERSAPRPVTRSDEDDADRSSSLATDVTADGHTEGSGALAGNAGPTSACQLPVSDSAPDMLSEQSHQQQGPSATAEQRTQRPVAPADTAEAAPPPDLQMDAAEGSLGREGVTETPPAAGTTGTTEEGNTESAGGASESDSVPATSNTEEQTEERSEADSHSTPLAGAARLSSVVGKVTATEPHDSDSGFCSQGSVSGHADCSPKSSAPYNRAGDNGASETLSCAQKTVRCPLYDITEEDEYLQNREAAQQTYRKVIVDVEDHRDGRHNDTGNNSAFGAVQEQRAGEGCEQSFTGQSTSLVSRPEGREHHLQSQPLTIAPLFPDVSPDTVEKEELDDDHPDNKASIAVDMSSLSLPKQTNSLSEEHPGGPAPNTTAGSASI